MAALMLCPLLCGVAAARNVALLVAVGKFGDPRLEEAQLLGTAADIDSVQQRLTEHWGFAPNDVHTLRNQEATHERILAEISSLEQRSSPGDTVFIYYSGHGTSANFDNNKYGLPYDTGAWVPYDIDLSTTATVQSTLIIGRRDLVPRLKQLDAGGRWVVVVSDSCYSGQVVRSFGQTHSASRFLPIMTRDLAVARVAPAAGAAPSAISARPPPPPYPYQHVLLLSGASDSETGADISSAPALELAPTLDGKFHGAFTDAFLRLMDGQFLPGEFNYAQGREVMTTFLEHRSFAQHPQLLPGIAEDPENIGSNPFLGMKIPARPGAAAAAPAAAARETVRVRLQAVSAPLRASVAGLSGVAIVDGDADMTLRQSGGQAQLTGPAGDPIVSTAAGDPTLIKRIAAQAWLNRALPVGTDALGLRAETDPASRGNTYVQCESFVFEVRLQKAAYVMVLDLDSQGNLTVLYPTRASERQIVANGAPRAIPGTDPKDRILVTPPFGSDQVTVFAFERLPAFFAGLTGAQAFAADSGRADALASGLAGTAGAVSVQHMTVRTYPGRAGDKCGS